MWWIYGEVRPVRKIGKKSSERNAVLSYTNMLHKRKIQNNLTALSSNSIKKTKPATTTTKNPKNQKNPKNKTKMVSLTVLSRIPEDKLFFARCLTSGDVSQRMLSSHQYFWQRGDVQTDPSPITSSTFSCYLSPDLPIHQQFVILKSLSTSRPPALQLSVTRYTDLEFWNKQLEWLFWQ